MLGASNAEVFSEKVNPPVRANRNLGRFGKKISELGDWTGLGAESGFKEKIQEISSSISTGITSNNSCQYSNFLTGAG